MRQRNEVMMSSSRLRNVADEIMSAFRHADHPNGCLSSGRDADHADRRHFRIADPEGRARRSDDRRVDNTVAPRESGITREIRVSFHMAANPAASVSRNSAP